LPIQQCHGEKKNMTEIRIPQASMEMSEGVLEVWLVDDGATVTEGQPIYSLETEKVVMEVPAPVAGVLRQIGKQGETYQVGDLVGEIQ
jgi:pyruvate/2-oxoglutarate dehydrogenase complex dihydrolipoamide acyltransferase (E2) component